MAILILVVGYIVLKIVISFIKEISNTCKDTTNGCNTVVILLSKLIFVIGMVFIILAAVGALGIDTGSVVLGISAILAFVIGFGMQDSSLIFQRGYE